MNISRNLQFEMSEGKELMCVDIFMSPRLGDLHKLSHL